MSEPPEEPMVGFRLHAVRVLRAAIDVEAQQGIDPADLNFNVTPVIGFNPETHSLLFALRVYVGTTDDVDTAFAHLITEIEFRVTNIRDGETEDMVAVPNELLQTGMATAISTTRGILWQRGLGTVLEKAPLPLIKPDEMVESAVERNRASGQQVREEQGGAGA